MDSILTSIKIQLGIPAEYTDFDAQIIMHINSVFMTLKQLGVGPKEGFAIEDDTAFWEDFISDSTKLQAVKTFMGLKVRLLFNPPDRSAVMEAFNRSASELEWRLVHEAEFGEVENQNG